MKINIFGNISNFNGTVAELIEIYLKERIHDVMCTLTLDGASSMNGSQPLHSTYVEFRVWAAPFRNFFSGHANMDGAQNETMLFELLGTSGEILEAVAPLIEGKIEWQAISPKNRKLRLWLSRDIG